MPRNGVICIAGPPGAGKTTLVERLLEETGGSVFRLRDALRTFRIECGAPNPDPLGWASDTAVTSALDLAAEHGQFAAADPPIILDNFPGSTAQLRLLHQWAGRWKLWLGVLELTASEAVLVGRVARRRVCPRCDPDLHAPSTVVEGAVPSCGSCGAEVLARSSDTPRTHTLRVERYRTNNRGLAATAEALGIPHRAVDANGRPDQVHRSALAAYAALLATSCSPTQEALAGPRTP